MKRPWLGLFLLLIMAGCFLAGTWYSHRSSSLSSTSSSGRRILYYVDPMHPAYKAEKPGIAPDCGMQLEPVYADGQTGGSQENGAATAGTVKITPEKQQVIGVRMGIVEETKGPQTLRTVGRVVPDDNKVYRILAPYDGWVRQVFDNSTGSVVKKGQPLFVYYNREFWTAQQGYIFAVSNYEQNKDETPDNRTVGPREALVQEARVGLEAQGMGDEQIKELERTRRPTSNVMYTAPAPGYIMARNVSVGLRFERNFELYRLADLSRVWILADVFENEAQYIRPGVMARVVVPAQAKEFKGRVSDILPPFDPATRTLKVRLEVENPEFVLRPDMFVDVHFPVNLPPTMAVPSDAVMDSGLKKTVFVDRGNGYFEPRTVQTGWRFGDRVEIVKGLMAGERIVVSGTFLVDSESRLKAAAAGIYGAASKDPTCGMDVDEEKARVAGKTAEYDGKNYFFCSEQCKRNFQSNPAKYVQKVREERSAIAEKTQSKRTSGAGGAAAYGAVKDPVCGMEVDAHEAAAAGRKVEHGGKTYYFCNNDCKQKFQKEPARYIKPVEVERPTVDKARRAPGAARDDTRASLNINFGTGSGHD